ncbi:MAG: radical SAM protein [Clostridiales bacterium]|nr:radical SAM protein [Clostridiales bacterium]
MDPLYKAEKERKKNYGEDKKDHSFENLQKRHPCLGGHSNVTAGRLHLPVSPVCNIGCRFCSRGYDKSVIRPGVSSLVLKPEEAVETVRKAKEICPELTVVGIAGPGDTLATDSALQTFRLVKENFPELICCLSTNGFYLPDKIEEIAEIGIETLTVTVNAIDPEIEEKINSFVIDAEGRKHEGIEGAKLLIERQLEGIRLAAQKGIVVKVNSVLVPGVNDKHIPEVAKKTSELGASILNIIPLIPQNEMKDIKAPTCADLEEVREEAGKYLEVFRHCQHCRADSLGIPGKGRDLHNELYKDREERAADTFSHG